MGREWDGHLIVWKATIGIIRRPGLSLLFSVAVASDYILMQCIAYEGQFVTALDARSEASKFEYVLNFRFFSVLLLWLYFYLP